MTNAVQQTAVVTIDNWDDPELEPQPVPKVCVSASNGEVRNSRRVIAKSEELGREIINLTDLESKMIGKSEGQTKLTPDRMGQHRGDHRRFDPGAYCVWYGPAKTTRCENVRAEYVIERAPPRRAFGFLVCDRFCVL